MPSSAHAHTRRTPPGPVLLATDGRSAASGAVRVAAQAARRLGAPVQTVAILEPIATYGAELLVVLPPEFDAGRKADTREAVRAQLAELVGPETGAWPLDTELGAPAQTLAQLAEARGASLLVLGIGRHSPFDRLFGTETALRALRSTERPVLAVPTDATRLPTRAVAAVDFTPASVRAAEVAMDLMAEGGTLVLAHVKPGVNAAQPLLADWDRAYTQRVDDLFGRLQALLAERRPDVRLATAVAIGDPADQLLQLVAREEAELLAAGTHGAGFVERVLVGSVATALLRRATCMVLAAQEPNAADVARIERRMLGTAEVTDPTGWAATLAEFTHRNAGRRTRLEVNDPSIGAQVEERGFALLGAAYDRRDGRVELMLGDPVERRRHVTRTVPHVSAVAVSCDADGRDRALRVEHGSGQTLLTFET
ncbi:MAG TPA: universal stress protein [Gemmatirosa sp.]|nr:universal stress protein [Gemmatirosa sp.]